MKLSSLMGRKLLSKAPESSSAERICSAFSVSSGNADANGYGNFEYSVPNSYYSLCTKNLAEFG